MEPGLRSVHSIYKLTVGGMVYFGYTARDPRERLEEHIDTARKGNWKHNSDLYPKLVECDFKYEFDVIGEHRHEVPALLQEILEIRNSTDPVLNRSPGGEGSTVLIRIRKFKNGNIQYKVVPRKKPKQKSLKKRRRRRR